MADSKVQPELAVTDTLPEGYRETQIGLVPEDWKVIRLEDAVNEIVSGDWGLRNKLMG